MGGQAISGHRNIQVLVRDSPLARVQIGGRTTAELWVPKLRQQLHPGGGNVDLLLAKYAITNFIGRTQLWQDCLQWCEGPEPISIRCITGQAGSGKTRFGLELFARLRQLPDWDVRFVRFVIASPSISLAKHRVQRMFS
jgi:hypothetical protein